MEGVLNKLKLMRLFTLRPVLHNAPYIKRVLLIFTEEDVSYNHFCLLFCFDFVFCCR